MTFNSGSELSKVAAQISSSQTRSAELDASNQAVVLGKGNFSLQEQFIEFILRSIVRGYEAALATEITEEKLARKALASA